MTKDQKVIRAKVGLLELAKQPGNVSQASKPAIRRHMNVFVDGKRAC